MVIEADFYVKESSLAFNVRLNYTPIVRNMQFAQRILARQSDSAEMIKCYTRLDYWEAVYLLQRLLIFVICYLIGRKMTLYYS